MDKEKQTGSNEDLDLTGDVFIQRLDGSIAKGTAIKNNLVDNDVAYSVVYEVEGETRRRFFRKGDLEAMQSDVSKQLEAESELRRVQLGPRLAGQAIDTTMSSGQPDEIGRLKERLDGSPPDLQNTSNPQEAAVGPVEGFNADKASLERGYRDALGEKARAQKEGRGDDSIYWGQQAGQYARELREYKNI